MKRLHSLDALRGIAALSVVLWHWQHFWAISGTWQVGWRVQSEPFYWGLKLFYDAGWAAVDLFFALSGYIFFWLYSEAIAARTVGPGRFAVLRFSRLYPLHFVTLVAVAVMQIAFHNATGGYFIYDVNDWQHFLSGLVMAQQWLPPTLEQTFNGPAWSVSIEILLYIVFFALARAGLKGYRAALDVVGIGILVFFLFNEMIGRGLIGFFMGGIVYMLAERIKQSVRARKIAIGVVLAALAGWSVIIVETYYGFIASFAWHLAGPLKWPASGVFAVELRNVMLLAFILIVSPLTLLALSLDEQVIGGRYHRLSFLGDISYSSYLLHFPMQLALALLALRFGWHPKMFQNAGALVLFYVVLIALASASYAFFERPLQDKLRRMKLPVLFPAE